MTEVVVFDMGPDDIAGHIAARLEEDEGRMGDVLIRSIRSLKDIAAKRPDILVLSEDAATVCRKLGAPIGCGILLMPGDGGICDTTACDADAGTADMFDAGCIATYGMSPKNTVTLSSISEEICVLALQRELVTTGGDVLERQEIMIRGGMRPACLLAVAGTLLLLGRKLSDINP